MDFFGRFRTKLQTSVIRKSKKKHWAYTKAEFIDYYGDVEEWENTQLVAQRNNPARLMNGLDERSKKKQSKDQTSQQNKKYNESLRQHEQRKLKDEKIEQKLNMCVIQDLCKTVEKLRAANMALESQLETEHRWNCSLTWMCCRIKESQKNP